MLYVQKVIQINIKKVEIKNLNKIKLKSSEFLFHAGTKIIIKKYAIGGRVLNFVALSSSFGIAKNIINHLKKLNWSGGFYEKI